MSDTLRPASVIQKEIADACGRIGGSTTQWAQVATPFSELLVKLSSDAEKTAHKLIVLTWSLIGLTVILIVMTAVLIWMGMRPENHEHAYQDNEHANEYGLHQAEPNKPTVSSVKPVKE